MVGFAYLWKELSMPLFILFLYVLETRFYLAPPPRSLGSYHDSDTVRAKNTKNHSVT